MRIRSLAVIVALATAALCGAANANITYNLNQTIGAGGVTGDIVTDGTIGVLGSTNILDWNLNLNDGTNTVNLSKSNSVLDIFTALGLSATATELLFDFSSSGEVIFESTAIPTDGYLCFISSSFCTGSPPPAGSGEEVVSATTNNGNLQITFLSGTRVIGIAATLPFAGKPGTAICHGQTVAALSNQYGTLDAAASALGFSSVNSLQVDIRLFCGH